MRRSPLRRVSKKRAAANRVLAKAALLVRARSLGACEAAFSAYCTSRGTQAHHVVRRSQGGQDTPQNLLWVCTPCHTAIHAQPEAARAAKLLRTRTTWDG
jgi:5-methylcytosine-specific restriction protein A